MDPLLLELLDKNRGTGISIEVGATNMVEGVLSAVFPGHLVVELGRQHRYVLTNQIRWFEFLPISESHQEHGREPGP
jgi:hypothetical protein